MAQEESSWLVLDTWDNSDNPKSTRLPFSLASMACESGISSCMFSLCDSVLIWRMHCIGSSIQMVAEELSCFAVMSVVSPGVVGWHILCSKLGGPFPKASHLTHPWPRIIYLHLVLLSQESDSRPSAFSEVLTNRLIIVHWIE